MARNRGSNSQAQGARSLARSRGRFRWLPLLALFWPQLAIAETRTDVWESPFQAGRPDLLRDRLRPVPATRCDHAAYNKCIFAARVDYDQDGKVDWVRMVDGPGVGALVVEFAGKPKRRPMTIASFKDPWAGSCYIEPSRTDRTAVAFTCPESSAAVFKMRNGKPAVRWTGD